MRHCDIIIPTYNNEAALPLTLAALQTQQVPPGWRVRVVMSDDGSTDTTLRVARVWHTAWEVVVLPGPHTGPAGARNRGLARARGEVVLWLGADIGLRPGALAAHLQWHEQHPDPREAALGIVMWDPRLRAGRLQEWMAHGGPQNNYDAILGQRTVDPRHYFSGSHLSLKRAALQTMHFAEDFVGYGWEDQELGQRLAAAGLLLTVLPAARGLHYHHLSAAAIGLRQQQVGRGLVTYQRLHSDVTLLPYSGWWRHSLRRLALWLWLGWLLGKMVAYGETRWTMPYLFQAYTSLIFWEGVYKSRYRTGQ